MVKSAFIMLLFFFFILLECLAPTAEEGYTIGTPTGFTIGSTAVVSCAAGYTGTPQDINCEENGGAYSWTAQLGCIRGK